MMLLHMGNNILLKKHYYSHIPEVWVDCISYCMNGVDELAVGGCVDGGEKWESKQMDGHKRQKHKEETLTYKYTQQSSIDNSKLKT